MCWIWFGPKEVEYTNEDKVTSLSNVLLQLYIYIYICCSFYNSIQLIISSNNFSFILQICKQNYPFQEALQFQKSIAFCCNMHTIVMMTTWVPLLLT
jgi:hypothetical protein